jgi:hypothetical protein
MKQLPANAYGSQGDTKPSVDSRRSNKGGDSRPPAGGNRQDQQSQPNNCQGNRFNNSNSIEARNADQIHFIFNEPLYRIMQDIKDKEFFERPRPMLSNSANRRQDKRCDYHEDVGHHTNDCVLLKRHLDDLAEKGHLKKYLKDNKRKRVEGNPQPQNNWIDDRATSGNTIDTIHRVISRPQAS